MNHYQNDEDVDLFDCDKVFKELNVAERKREGEIKKSIHKIKHRGNKKNKHKISPNPEKLKSFGIQDMMACPIINPKVIIEPIKHKNISTPDYKNIKEYNTRSLKNTSKTFRNLNDEYEDVPEENVSSEVFLKRKTPMMIIIFKCISHMNKKRMNSSVQRSQVMK